MHAKIYIQYVGRTYISKGKHKKCHFGRLLLSQDIFLIVVARYQRFVEVRNVYLHF